MDLLSFIQKGGVIVEVLLALNFIGFTIIIWKFLVFIGVKKNISNIIKKLYEKDFDYEVLNTKIEKYVKDLESGLNTIKIIAQVSPLLGLLGTVIGVFKSFEAISKSGLGDPTVFSNGISIALITTIAGLIVAIIHYVGYNYLIGFLDNLEVLLKEKVFYEKKRDNI